MRASGGKNWSSSNTPSLRIGGLPTMPTERRQVERASLAPRVGDQVREQDVLAARQRIGGDADEAEQPGDVSLDLVADELGVAHVGRRLERADDVDRHAGSRSGRVDREVDRRLQRRRCSCRRQPPAGEALAPRLGLLGGEGVGRERLRSPPGVRRSMAGSRPAARSGNVQAQVGQIALGIDQQCRAPRRSAPPRSARCRDRSCPSPSCRRSRRAWSDRRRRCGCRRPCGRGSPDRPCRPGTSSAMAAR